MKPGLVQHLRRRFVDALQRGLFEDSPPAVAPQQEQESEPALAHQPQPRPQPPQQQPGTTAAESPLPHPRANRRLRIDGFDVHYALRRTRRRTIGFVVGAEGLSVSAPKWLALRDVDLAVAEKGRWILAKLAEQRERSLRTEATRIVWQDGAQLRYLGQPITLQLDAGHGLAEGEVVLDDTEPRALHIGLPRGAAEERVRDAVQSWLQREARRVFAERAAHFAARLGVRVTRLSLSSAQTRWGSASASGAVRLHWKLIHHGLPTIDYVVAHELAHLREMNHSARFWDVVRSVVPDYEEARKTLREEAAPR